MNIKERASAINRYQNLLNLTNKKVVTIDIETYLKNLVKPPIRYYLPYQIISQLYTITMDSKLANTPLKRFQLQNDLLSPYGFKPLASGTNRRTFYNEYDTSIVLKIASDMIGRTDNTSEFTIQNVLLPFCPKIFDVDSTGTIQLSERVETMSEKDYKEVWFEEIFDLINDFYEMGYIFDDIGLYSFKNLGVRLEFGPVILDFPYMYKIDWRKLKCEKIDPITHERCNGTIGYNYESMMSELICYKCGVRYSAKYLASPITGEEFNNSVLGRKNTMRRIISTDIPVRVKVGDQIVFDPKNTTNGTVQYAANIVPAQQPIHQQQYPQYQYPQRPQQQPQYQYPQRPQQQPQRQYPQQQRQMQYQWPDQQQVQYAKPAQSQDNNPFYPQYFDTLQTSQPNPFITTELPKQQLKQEAEQKSEEPKRIFYQKILKNDIIQWLKNMESKYDEETVLFLADRLGIEYIPRSRWQKERQIQQQQPTQVAFTPQAPIQFQAEQHDTVNIFNRPTPVQTVIAPQTKPASLKVEDPTYWENFKMTAVGNTTNEVPTEQIHPTSGLEIMKPMTMEEIEEADRKNRGNNAMLGIPGVPMIDTMKIKEVIPKIQTMVEQRFNNFILSADAEQQAFQLSQDIARFISSDIQALMKDDGKGLLVTATRTVDNKNKDCYEIKVFNYGSPLFITTLYPEEQPTQQQVPQPAPSQASVDEDPLLIPIEELISFFESIVQKFDSSKYKDINEVKLGLITFLCDATVVTYRDKITVPRARKEAAAYVNQAVKFNAKPQAASKPLNMNQTIAGAL